ncbi:MAG: hypothetical protein WCS77_01125 [Elusimicrobiaceae bacterium]
MKNAFLAAAGLLCIAACGKSEPQQFINPAIYPAYEKTHLSCVKTLDEKTPDEENAKACAAFIKEKEARERCLRENGSCPDDEQWYDMVSAMGFKNSLPPLRIMVKLPDAEHKKALEDASLYRAETALYKAVHKRDAPVEIMPQ